MYTFLLVYRYFWSNHHAIIIQLSTTFVLPFQEQDKKSQNMNVHQGRTKQPMIRWRPVLGVWIRAYCCCCCSAMLYHFYQRSVVNTIDLYCYILLSRHVWVTDGKSSQRPMTFTRTPVQIRMIETKHVMLFLFRMFSSYLSGIFFRVDKGKLENLSSYSGKV